MGQAPVRFAQISDMHLFGDAKGELLGVNTEKSFQAVLDLLQSQTRELDFVILSGDLSQDGSMSSYTRLALLVQKLKLPIYYVPGNHDSVKTMLQVYPCGSISNHRHIVLKSWHIILLNSKKPGAVEGYLDAAQLQYLQDCLQAYPEHQALVMFHHQPVPVGAKWLDNLGLTNADEFWDIVKRYPNMNSVLFGHVHQEFAKVVEGIQCYSTPSTCIQFMRNQDHFGLENLPPGYRWVNLCENGKIETGVNRVDHYVGYFDADAKGY